MPAGEYSVYLVRCSDGSLYTGITKNVSRRIEEHEQGAMGANHWNWFFNDRLVIGAWHSALNIVSNDFPGQKKKMCSNCRSESIR